MSRHDPEWLNAQYNNRDLVPDHERHLAHWAEASALTRSKSDCRLDLRYGSGPQESLDLFLRRALARRCWCSCTAATGAPWTRATSPSSHRCSTQAGAMVVVPNYSLCPAVSDRAHHLADGARTAMGVAQRGAARR